KLEREEEKLKNHNRDLSMVKMKSMFAIGFAFTALLSMFNSMSVSRSPRFPVSLLITLLLTSPHPQLRRSHRRQAALCADRPRPGTLSPQPRRQRLHRLLIHLSLHSLYHVHSPEHSKAARLCAITCRQ